MGLATTTAATQAVLGYFWRLRAGTPDPAADAAAERVLGVLDHLGRGDPPTRTALDALRARPEDPQARAVLEERIESCTQASPAFRGDLSRATGVAAPRPRPSWLVPVASGSALLLLMLCAVGGWVFWRSSTTAFDTKTDLTSAGGWTYRVSEAHLKTSAQLDGRSPAKPGYRYVYFDITVENRLDDRTAPGIDFHFARPESSMAANCGARQTGMFGPVSSYSAGVVAGWCVSNQGNPLFGGGASCYETNDSFFRGVDRIPAGGDNRVRCVDSYLVTDDFDLSGLRVYYVGSGDGLPHLKQIPTST